MDFVVTDKSGIAYFQVASSAQDKNTLARGLNLLQKNNRLLSEIYFNADYDGIKRINALDWLIDETKK